MTEYYENCLQKGLEYQDYVSDILIEELGFPLSNYSSKSYQYGKGENKQGVEIKFDNKHKDTGNLYIETEEKTKRENNAFVESGILRSDNTWLYVIGNYEEIYIFAKKYLKLMMPSRKIIDIKMGTSRGFLLNTEEINKYCIKKITIKNSENNVEGGGLSNGSNMIQMPLPMPR